MKRTLFVLLTLGVVLMTRCSQRAAVPSAPVVDAETRDPKSIRILTGFVRTSSPSFRTLVRFGSRQAASSSWRRRAVGRGKLDHGRPADITFAADGRMFVAQDVGPNALNQLGIVFWIAPLDLPKP